MNSRKTVRETMAAATRPPDPGLTTYQTVDFETQVSCFDQRNLTFTVWRSLYSSKRMDLAIAKAEKVRKACAREPYPDRVRVVRIESTCTVLHEIK